MTVRCLELLRQLGRVPLRSALFVLADFVGRCCHLGSDPKNSQMGVLGCALIQCSAGGHGLHDILVEKRRMLRFSGILNGIDDEWDPRTDSRPAEESSVQNAEINGMRFCQLSPSQGQAHCLQVWSGVLCSCQKGM